MAEVLACRKSRFSKGPAVSLGKMPARAEKSRSFVCLASRAGETRLRRGASRATARRTSLKPAVSTPPGQTPGESQEFLAVELAIAVLIELKCLLDEFIRIRRPTTGTTVLWGPRTFSSGPAATVAPG